MMSKGKMTSMQRVLTTLGHKEPDRVPLFLLLTTHGAKELGLSIKEYFSKAVNVVEGQLRLRQKYNHDCLFGFFYASAEIEAWGGEIIYSDAGPPNAGKPFISSSADIDKLSPPKIEETPVLKRILETIRLLDEKSAGEVPVLGVAVSAFSVPVMQMGFEAYLDLIHEQPRLFERLMEINEDFCVNWANAQLKAGATAICYFDPVSSPTIIPRDHYLTSGYLVAKRIISRINGPVATHLASGASLPIIDDIAETGSGAVGISAFEDLAEVKEACRNKLTVIGNLNGIEMARWSKQETTAKVKEAIFKAAPGGGFILADNHGEIPYQVPDDVLLALSEAVNTYGCYPIDQAVDKDE